MGAAPPPVQRAAPFHGGLTSWAGDDATSTAMPQEFRRASVMSASMPAAVNVSPRCGAWLLAASLRRVSVASVMRTNSRPTAQGEVLRQAWCEMLRERAVVTEFHRPHAAPERSIRSGTCSKRSRRSARWGGWAGADAPAAFRARIAVGGRSCRHGHQTSSELFCDGGVSAGTGPPGELCPCATVLRRYDASADEYFRGLSPWSWPRRLPLHVAAAARPRGRAVTRGRRGRARVPAVRAAVPAR
jgi:hypothetical protein